jgi:hypothetical protein
MQRAHLFAATLIGAGLVCVGSAQAQVIDSPMRMIVIKDVVPPEISLRPAPPEPPAPPSTPDRLEVKDSPSAKLGPAAKAMAAPAYLGADIADFMARTIQRQVAGEPAKRAPAKPKPEADG